MSAGGALLELARRHGIEPGYHDIWGHWHPLAEGTARALLAAMGVDASDDGTVDEALARSEHSGWDTLLPPVVVAREGDAAQVVLCLPAARDGDALAWTLELEDGARRDGEARADLHGGRARLGAEAGRPRERERHQRHQQAQHGARDHAGAQQREHLRPAVARAAPPAAAVL